MSDPPDRFDATIERFSGFAADYDRYRPDPPTALAGLLAQFRDDPSLDLLVDLGSGTGLSSRYWTTHAHQIVGIEPSSDMRQEARRRAGAANIRYQNGYSHATGLPQHCAQIVTCMQSLHWMEPSGTFVEVHRVLVDGGVFAAIDYDWPPVSASWRVDQAWHQCNETASRLESALPGDRPPRWNKALHAARMQESGVFRFIRDLVLHQVDQCNAERFVGLLRCQGGVMDLIKAGYSESDLGIDQLERLANEHLGPDPRPIYWSARVRIGVV